ncbi:hypothetical protein [Nostoc sp.]|uniref:hypothetical protein n=1 Tax=Nostoc sp. TaxID=1180 RepID=UPI002FF59BDE
MIYSVFLVQAIALVQLGVNKHTISNGARTSEYNSFSGFLTCEKSKGWGGVGGVGGWGRSLTPHTPHTPHTPLPPSAYTMREKSGF